MKQKKIGTTLYVFETSAYEITRDTDAKEICIQQENLEAFIKINQAIADKMKPYNYRLLTVQKTIWADYINAPDVYSITLTGDSGEFVEVSADQADAGEAITITPKTGYTVANVNVTSSDVEITAGETNWTFTMPEKDVVLLAAIDTHLISTEGDTEAVTVSDNQAKAGDVVTITPTQRFSTVDVELSSDEVNFNTGESGWTFVMPDEDVAISVTIKSYNITTAGDSSYITVGNSAKVGNTVSVTPTNGATMNTISIVVSGGVEVTAGAEAYTFTMPSNDVSVTATLASHTITTAGDDTYISVSNSAKLGDTVEVTPANGASVDNISIAVSGGVEVTKGVSSYTFTMPNNDVTVTATLASFNISTAGDSSYISAPSSAKMFSTVEVTPINGGDMSSVSITVSGDIPVTTGTTSYTFTMPANDVTVTATYVEPHHDYSQDYLTFTAVTPSTFTFTEAGGGSRLEYSLDNGTTWTSLASATASPTVNTDETIIWRGQRTSSVAGIGHFSSTGRFIVSGNILSLTSGDNFRNVTTLVGLGNGVFKELFKNCLEMTNAENLVLPATTLVNSCYQSMFEGCTSLTTAPTLPATTLTNFCYQEMFSGCTSLTTAPTLPSTTLANNCYYKMFYACSSLTTAPSTLPATTLTDRCYKEMFSGCRNLSEITCLATDISAADCTTGWVSGVNASGTFYKNSSMQDWTTGNNGIPSGWTVQDAA